MTSPLVSVERKLIPLAQAYSMQGYSQKAVLPTPAAPIISTWTSPVSTIAVVFPVHPTTMPCGSGFPSSPVGVFPLFAWSRHFFGVKGMCL